VVFGFGGGQAWATLKISTCSRGSPGRCHLPATVAASAAARLPPRDLAGDFPARAWSSAGVASWRALAQHLLVPLAALVNPSFPRRRLGG
jgi:hypothetical protein